MKKISILLIALTGLLSSCCKNEDIASVYEEKRNNIIGTWHIDRTMQIFKENVLTDEFMYTTEMAFYDDGTGYEQSSSSQGEVIFSWDYQYAPEQVIIHKPNGTIPFYTTYWGSRNFFEVLINEHEHQVWQYQVHVENTPEGDYYNHILAMRPK
ncbi:MAG: hypothetical protein R2798_03680 [Chitinophagales bacterium]|nr:hypothetical protein [Bacteroidota bacterium]MCB9043084.1 hypothetical protein [Chitinophagales bacterium]